MGMLILEAIGPRGEELAMAAADARAYPAGPRPNAHRLTANPAPRSLAFIASPHTRARRQNPR